MVPVPGIVPETGGLTIKKYSLETALMKAGHCVGRLVLHRKQEAGSRKTIYFVY
jgi:hypothetical protein